MYRDSSSAAYNSSIVNKVTIDFEIETQVDVWKQSLFIGTEQRATVSSVVIRATQTSTTEAEAKAKTTSSS
jgi:hypothetical protein